MHVTLRQLDKALEAIATGHDQLADYFWGDWRDAFDQGVTRKFSIMVCNVSAAPTFNRVTTDLPINIAIADQVAKDHSNLKEVESDTMQMLRDVYNIIRNSPNWTAFCAIKTATVPIKFKDSTPDEVAGWQMQIVLKLIDSRGLCDLPLTNYDFNQPIRTT